MSTIENDESAFIWLNGDEDESAAECGCRLVRNFRDSGDPAFVLCEKHSKAMTNNTFFTIRPFEWSQNNRGSDIYCVASTPFGNYRVDQIDGTSRWSYCFDEHYDEDSIECESIEDGKTKAWQHWVDRISQISPATEQ